MRRQTIFAGVILLAAMLGCQGPARTASTGFDLPEGDIERGHQAFVSLECSTCHSVVGYDLPGPTVDPPVGVDLRVASRRCTDGELVTSIIQPDHRISLRWASGVKAIEGHTRMGSYAETMTVQQLSDIVAFLRAAEKGGGERVSF